MKRLLPLLTCLFLAITLNAKNVNVINSARVTYLANCGFMVKAGESTLLFDGAFQNGMDRYQQPETATVELMKNALPPFDEVDVVFVSNFQSDHCDPYVLTQFMLHNTNAKLVCPQQVINKLQIFTRDYALISKRIVEATPVVNRYDRLMVNGIEIIACNVKNEKRINDHIENIAYLVNLNGVKLFHSGDSSIETLDDLKGINLNRQQVDIAFLNVSYGIGNKAKQTNKLVDAHYTVLMHLEKYITDKTLNAFCEHSKLTSKPYVFNIRNQYLDFYLNDFYAPEAETEMLSLY